MLSAFLDLPHSAVAGCPQCVRLYEIGAGGEGVGANARTVIVPGKEQDSVIQFAGGQSGQFGAAHYADRQDDWVSGRATPLRSRDVASTILLTPTGARDTR